MRLYSFQGSSSSLRVRIALALKSLSLEIVEVDLPAGEHAGTAFRQRNPQGMVPCLEIGDGQFITQSAAIVDWLERNYPAVALIPAQPAARARVLAFCNVIGCDIHALQGLRLKTWLRDAGLDDDACLRVARRAIEEGLAACEHLIGAAHGPFCFGEQPSMADAWLIPQMRNARRYGIDLSAYPTLLRADENGRTLPAVAALLGMPT